MTMSFMLKKITVLFLVLFYYMSVSSHDVSQLNTDDPHLLTIAIIGSGYAGCSAALSVARFSIPTYVFVGPQDSGQLAESSLVENIPGVMAQSGWDIMASLRDQASAAGALFLDESIVEVDFNQWPFVLRTDNDQEYRALSVIIATGSSPRMLGVPGEARFYGKGVSICAKCDLSLYKKQDTVVVVGGGDAAIDHAQLLATRAGTVKVLVRSQEMRATPSVRSRIDGCTNIEIIVNKRVVEVLGDEELTGVLVEDAITGERSEISCRGVFLAIGHIPNTSLFKQFLPLTRDGYIQLYSRHQTTEIPGVFAAGDVTDSFYQQAVVAGGDGVKAGIDATDFLHEIGVNEQFIKRFADLTISTHEKTSKR